MTAPIALKCDSCQKTFPFQSGLGQCPHCGGDWLDPIYDLAATKQVWAAELAARPQTMWRYWELLPLVSRENIVSMGEGYTPLIHLPNLGLMLGHQQIYLKDERQTPTGSFKDRQASLAISTFKENGINEFAVASTGNVGISYSAYAARAGIKVWAFLNSAVPQDKMREIALYGTEVIKVTASYDRTKKVAARFARRQGIYYDKGVKNIAAKEAMKTVAFEIAEQLGAVFSPADGKFIAPDWYVQAVSGGLGPVGVWKGFLELKEMGLIDRLPKMAHIQAAGCAPMVSAFDAGLDRAKPVEIPQTLIATVATGDPGDVYPHLRQIALTHGGHFEAIPDDESFHAMHVLAQLEGISMEPAPAMAFAGLFKMIGRQIIKPTETVVVNCSGHTFPVEKHLLDDRRVRALHQDVVTPDTGEGVLAALDNLDARIRQIVIVEDDPNAARLLRRILDSRGKYQIYHAADGKYGLELIRQKKPDLVLLDLMMPEMDGFTVLDRLKAESGLKHIPVVVLTAKSLSAYDRDRLSGRVQALLHKGNFTDDDLLEDILASLEDKPL